MAGDRPGRLDSLLVFVAAVAVYALYAQDTMYGIDAWNDLRRLHEGDTRSAVHLLYLPIANECAQLGAKLGLTLHESVRWFSVLGTALGLVFMHAASRRLGLGRGAALAATLAAGCAPGVAFYATVVERHGPFLAFAGLACWLSARWATAPRWWWSFALGLACALAYAAHSTGVLLVALLVPIGVVGIRERGERWRAQAAIVVVTAAVGTYVASRLGVWLGHTTVAGGNFAILIEFASVAVRHPEVVGRVAWHEFAFPLMPISVLWIARWFQADGRAMTLATGFGIAVYFVFAFLILAGFDAVEGFDERGAYLLPLAWPLSYATVRTLGAWSGVAAALVAAMLAHVQIAEHDVAPQRQRAEALRQASGRAEPFLIVATRDDFEMLFVEFGEYRPVQAGQLDGDYLDLFLASHNEDLAGGRGVAPLLPLVVRSRLDAGRVVWISRSAVEFLEAPDRVPHAELGPLFLEALRGAFRWVESDVPDGYIRLDVP